MTKSGEWHDGTDFVDENGALKLSFLNLHPQKYELEVIASDDGINYVGEKTCLRINIMPPWWQTWWAYCFYFIILFAIIYFIVIKYTKYKEKNLRQQHREAMLLQQIQQLMNSLNPSAGEEDDEQMQDSEALSEDPNAEDTMFVQNAITLVEQHLKESYSVEMLAKDLCMERTGLYKRLTTLVKKSPQTFIRSIRLNHAATMLRQGVSVTETSEATGFNSVSYFSRAFTKEFGVSPSEYASHQEKR